jgi:glycerol-1-phosphate dehydrogenase [NAD(P)+]
MTLPFPEPRVARPTYGRKLLASLSSDLFERPIVVTQPVPWSVVSGKFPSARFQLHMVESMEHATVRDAVASFGPAGSVFGIGGGMALDMAKYVAWKLELPLVLLPTVLSVDAAFTKAIAVREGSRVRYVGEVFPEHLLIDFHTLRTAPRLLNRAGAGDVFSIFTALWDWKQAAERLGEKHSPEVAAESQKLLDRLYAGAQALRDATDEGLELLSELYVGEVRLCERVGNSRPEEGSEHYVAYCHEALTGRSYVHGQLVGLGVLLAGLYQGQDVSPVHDLLRRLELDCRPGAMGTTDEEVVTTLQAMADYVKAEKQLLPGVFHFKGAPGASEARDLLRRAVGP